MKYAISLIVFTFLLACTPTPKDSFDLVVANVNLIDGTGAPLRKGVSVGIRDGKIVAIDSLIDGKEQNRIDGEGKYLIPGLFDGHVHIGDYEEEFPAYIHYGVTSIFVTGGSLATNDFYAVLRERGNHQDSLPAPMVFHTSQHFSMEGRHPSKTYVSPNWRDGESIFYLRDTLQIEEIVAQVAQQPIVGIKLTIEDGPAPPFVERMPQAFVDKVVKEAAKYNLEVFAHASDNIEWEMALTAGVQNLLHYTGIDIDPKDSVHMRLLDAFKTRDPSWVTTLMLDKSFMYAAYPEWFEKEGMLSRYQELKSEITSDQVARAIRHKAILQEAYGLTDDTFYELMKPQVEDIRFLNDQGIIMVLGTDVGNDLVFPGYSLHEEMLILEKGGMPPLEIIRMGTLNAAKMVHAADSLGSIEKGKVANMVLLNENPLEDMGNTMKIHSVIKNGVVQKRIQE